MNTANYEEDGNGQYAVAVIGTAGRFCRADSADALWENLQNGFEAVRFLDRETLKANGCPERILSSPSFVPASAMMERVDEFDAEFFGFTPAEARMTDPQLRLMLQASWHAFESAGALPGAAQGLTGVFAGAHRSDYLLCTKGPEYSIMVGMQALSASILNGQDYLASWISYKLGLTGPSLTVQSACSTGLSVVATACQNLLDHSCDTALAVAGAVFNPRDWGYLAETGSILSADGHCRPFDVAAGGTVTGEGVGAVLLKRLPDALRDNDPILGVIRGYAVNNDGPARAGYAAPSVTGQTALLEQALAASGLAASQVGYIEAHGTATPLGDPIEFTALQNVFGQEERDAPCLLGAIKANLGHLGACAGMAGLIKALFMLGKNTVPPQINFTAPNPAVPLEASAFRIDTQGGSWPSGVPKVAGVSSFGLGGTNCHVIVEAWEDDRASGAEAIPLPLCLSARSEPALRELCERWSLFLEQQPGMRGDAPGTAPADAPAVHYARAALRGRADFSWRAAVPSGTAVETARLLRDPSPVRTAGGPGEPARTALLVTGGALHRAVPEALLRQPGTFRDTLSRLASLTGFSGTVASLSGLETMAERQPRHASLAVGLSFARLLEASGFRPQVYLGERTGALAAAVLAGTLPPEAAFALLDQQARGGSFSPEADGTGVRCPETLIAGPEGVSPAGLRADCAREDAAAETLSAKLRQCRDGDITVLAVLGGSAPSEEALRTLAGEGHAFTVAGFFDAVPGVTTATATVPVTSGSSPIPAKSAEHPPSGVPVTPAGSATPATPGGHATPVLPGVAATPAASEPSWETAFSAGIGSLFLAGASLSPEGDGPPPVLPLYPFARERHWLEEENSFSSLMRRPDKGDSPPPQAAGPAKKQCACTCAGACAEPASTEPGDGGPQSNGKGARPGAPEPGTPDAVSGTLGTPGPDASRDGEDNGNDDVTAYLSGIWNAALGIADIAPDDDFFARGGTSLSAIAIIADIEKLTGLSIPLREFLRLKTINKVVSRLLELSRERQDAPDAPPVRPETARYAENS